MENIPITGTCGLKFTLWIKFFSEELIKAYIKVYFVYYIFLYTILF